MSLRQTYILLVPIAFLLVSCFKIDNTPPEIFLKGSLQVQVPIHSKYIEPGFKATDDRDGDISYLVEISDSVNSELANYYFIYYNVTDASGNRAKQVNRIVEVYHTVNHLTTVYSKVATCSFGNLSNESVTINPKGGSNSEFRISGITDNGKILNGYIYGNNNRLLKIPVQYFTDTIYFGEGTIDNAGNIIEMILNRQINNNTDTCNITLTRY
jgi:hypothetical protein